MRIVHLPDLKLENGEKTGKNNYPEKLITALGYIAEKRPIDYILMTGDITHTAAGDGYENAAGWLRRAAAVCRIPRQNIYVCRKRHTAGGPAMGFYLYEIDSGGTAETDCIRIAYEFSGGLWHKWKKRVTLKNGTTDYDVKTLPYRFSILWWTRISPE